MIFMLLFWVSLVVNGILYILLRSLIRREKASDIAIIISFLSLALLIVAIVTKDPLFANFGVPAEFEWIVGVFIAGLTSWQLYFNPLKERLIKVERKVEILHTEVSSVKEDTTLIKEKILQR